MPIESKANGKSVTLNPNQHSLPKFKDMTSETKVGTFPLKPSSAFKPSWTGWR